jgi:serine protease AprX
MKKIFLFSIAFLFLQNLKAQYMDWEQKVSKSVLLAAQNQKTDFIIAMAEQADVSDAYTLKTKEEKGRFVFKKLQSIAEQTQKNVVFILEKNNCTFRSYLINNTLWAIADLNTIKKIALLPEVKAILYNPSVKGEEAMIGASETGGQRAVEWSIAHINADDVWALAGNPTGQNVVIAGEDTGYQWDHPALKTHYRGWNGASANHNFNWHDAIHTIDIHNSGSNPCGLNSIVPCDDQQHGTHTMGTMVGDDGAGNQIGVAPGAKWIGCRNMERNWGTPATYTECFNFFLAPTDLSNANPDITKAPHVINNSWACPAAEGCTDAASYAAMETAVNNLTAAGIVVVVSAGNSGSTCSTIDAPAAIFQNSFTVGASNNLDVIANFSSRGPAILNGINRRKPDVTAPGVNIRSCVPGNTYASGWNGTSMAGPHVAGTVALIIAAKPSMAGNVAGITSVLRTTAIRPSISFPPDCTTSMWAANWPNNVYGDGRIDALAAVNAAVLPIKLKEFRGLVKENSNQLFWITELEVNSDYFLLEKSTDGVNFSSVGKILTKGRGLGEERYDFTDKIIEKSINYYRLKQVDKDGTFEYSNIIVLKNVKTQTVKIGPNPTKGFFSVDLESEQDDILDLKIINISGQMIKTLNVNVLQGKNYFSINLEDLPKGAYNFLIESERKNFFYNQLLILSE